MYIKKVIKIINNVKVSFYSLNNYLNENLLKKLNIYYERNNKNYKNINLIGNAYRNSKWLYYSIRNIKIDSLTLIAYILFIMFLLYSLNIYIYSKNDNNLYIIPSSFKGLILDLWYILFMNLINVKNQFLIIIYSIILILMSQLNNIVDLNFLYFFKKLLKVEKKVEKNFFLLRYRNKNKILLSIKKLNLIRIKLNIFQEVKFTLGFKKMKNYNDNFFNKKIGINKRSLLKDIKFFTYNLYTNKIYLLNNLKLNNIFTFNYKYLLNENLITIYTIIKGNRWYFKNTMLTNKLINFIQKNTNTKKLIGLNILNLGYINSNIWYSTKNKIITSVEILNFIKIFYKNFNKLLVNNKSYNNYQKYNNRIFYNFFENSFFWLNKKIYITSSINSSYVLKFLKNTNCLNFSKNSINSIYNINFIIYLNKQLENIYFNIKNYQFSILNNKGLVINYRLFITINNSIIKEIDLYLLLTILYTQVKFNNFYLVNNINLTYKEINYNL